AASFSVPVVPERGGSREEEGEREPGGCPHESGACHGGCTWNRGSSRGFRSRAAARSSRSGAFRSAPVASGDVFAPIEIDEYVRLHLASNPGVDRKDLVKRLRAALEALRAGDLCSCRSPIWDRVRGSRACLLHVHHGRNGLERRLRDRGGLRAREASTWSVKPRPS